MKRIFTIPFAAAFALMAFASLAAPPDLPGDLDIRAAPVALEHGAIYQAVDEFGQTAAAVLPAGLSPGARAAEVAEASALAPVYRLSWRTDARNLISPHMLC